MKYKSLILVSLVFYSSIFAKENKLSKINTSAPLLNETIFITPIKDHHFNLKAPQKCAQGPSVDKNTINLSARKVKCQYHQAGKHQVTVSVCDNEDKYCKQEKYQVTVANTSSNEPRMRKSLHANTQKMQAGTKKLLMQNFVAWSPEEVKSKASEYSAILVLVSTEWCPPCNMLKEFLLPTAGLKKITERMLLVYVDGDGPMMNKWRPYLESYYFPTFIALNHKLQVINLQAGFPYLDEFEKFISSSLESLNDPISKLQVRLDKRIQKNTLQKINDFFLSDEAKKQDQKRWLDYLESKAKHKEQLKYLTQFSAIDYSAEILRNKYYALAYGKDSKEMDKTKKEVELKALSNKILKAPLDGAKASSDWIYSSLLTQKCEHFGKKAQEQAKIKDFKTAFFSDAICEKKYQALLKSYDHIDQSRKYTKAETLLTAASKSQAKSKILLALKQDSLANKQLQDCQEKYNQLESHTPLKSKSRALGIYRSYCLDKKDTQQSLKLVQKLAQDYPFDSTFHSKLASLYLKEKQYAKALESNAKALTYSYGVRWIKAVLQKSKIQKAQKKTRAAFNTLKDALNEVVFDKNSKRSYWLETLRTEYESLQSKLTEK